MNINQIIHGNKEFYNNEMSEVLNNMLPEILKQKPKNIYKFMYVWLMKYKTTIKKLANDKNLKKPEGVSDSSDSENENNEEKDKAINLCNLENKRKPIRNESEDLSKYLKNLNLNFYQKNKDEEQYLKENIKKHFLFEHLNEEEFNIIINSLKEYRYIKDEIIINEQDQGNEMFFVSEGKLKCYINYNDINKRKLLKEYQPGDFFGELALLYNTTRSATIVSETNSSLFLLKRDIFVYIIKGSYYRKRKIFKDFISNVNILNGLSDNEIDKIFESVEIEKYDLNTNIINEGEVGDSFYIIFEGKCEAYSYQDNKLIKLYEFNKYDYFGEMALINDDLRKANVRTIIESKLIKVPRNLFLRICGSIVDVLKRNTNRYKEFKN